MDTNHHDGEGLGLVERGIPRLAGISRSGMALQREMPVPVWGWASPGETVTVEARRKERTGWRQGWSGFRNRTEGKYIIQVPAQFNVQLTTAGGGISVTESARAGNL